MFGVVSMRFGVIFGRFGVVWGVSTGNRTFRPQDVSPLVVSPLVVSPLFSTLVVSPHIP